MKIILLKIKEFITKKLIKICNLIIEYYTPKPNETPYESTFSSLMPKEDANISNYEKALDHAFKSPEKIKNIALSGCYGSGKSSIMHTYEAKHPNLKFLHISLAHFKDQIEQETNQGETKPQPIQHCPKINDSSNQTEITSLLEGKILNQLIHQINPSNITETRFNIKRSLSKKEINCQILSVCFLVFLTLYALLYGKWESLVRELNWRTLNLTISPIFRLLLILISCLTLFAIIKSFIKKNGLFKKFKKLEIKDFVGIEIFDSDTDSSFDKYLNEVVYLFKNCGADAIVFEDLDRYDSFVIFEKLREINYIVNINSSKTIRFFYLIKDDIFTSTDRSKFFDFIIPVIPFVDTSNSSDKLIELLDNANLKSGIDIHFLNDLSFYISDMRLLSNIVNEYQVYKNTINLINSRDNSTNQFAMIVYKNLFPEDFHALQAGYGYVYSIFEIKKDLCESKINSLNVHKKEILDEITKADSQLIQDIDDLNAIYFKLNRKVVRIGSETITDNITHTKLIKKIIENASDVHVEDRFTSNRLDVESLLSDMENNIEYQERLKNIKLLSSNKKKELQRKIEQITNDAKLIPTKRLADFLANSDDTDDFWENVNQKYNSSKNDLHSILFNRNYKLIKYLVSHGYINENYSLYCSYFYSNNLSPRDRNFIMSVYNGEKNSYEYNLNEPHKVLETINPNSFLCKNINNFDLLECVLRENRDTILKTWFDTIDHSGSYDFIKQFWKLNIIRKKLIIYIAKLCPKWFQILCLDSTTSNDEFIQIIFEIIDYCPKGTLAEINENNWLTDKISAEPRFLSRKTNNVLKYCKELLNINILFTSLETTNINNEILKYIYENEMYEINMPNILSVLKVFENYDIANKPSQLCTYLIKNAHTSVSMYLLNNINAFISVFINYSTKKFSDEQSTVLYLIRHPALETKNKIEYIKKSSIKIKNILDIPEIDIWPILLKEGAFSNTWKNLLVYYDKIDYANGSLSQELASAMSSASGITILKFPKLDSALTNDKAKVFIKNIVESTFLTLPHMKEYYHL